MANYQTKLVLRLELILRSSSYPKSKVTHCEVRVMTRPNMVKNLLLGWFCHNMIFSCCNLKRTGRAVVVQHLWAKWGPRWQCYQISSKKRRSHVCWWLSVGFCVVWDESENAKSQDVNTWSWLVITFTSFIDYQCNTPCLTDEDSPQLICYAALWVAVCCTRC